MEMQFISIIEKQITGLKQKIRHKQAHPVLGDPNVKKKTGTS